MKHLVGKASRGCGQEKVMRMSQSFLEKATVEELVSEQIKGLRTIALESSNKTPAKGAGMGWNTSCH